MHNNGKRCTTLIKTKFRIKNEAFGNDLRGFHFCVN
jgi:hypothetical protein